MQKIKKRIVQVGVLGASSLVLGLGAMAAQGAWRSYFADDPVGRNVVTIESRAPLETILTRTNQVRGEIKVNPENVLDHPTARFELDTASLDTGIPLRNEHMRSEGWMNTAKYPKAVFTLKEIHFTTPGLNEPVKLSLQDGKTVTLPIVTGTLELHGVTRPVTAQIEITPIAGNKDTIARLPGDLLHVRATFPIKLSDFGIEVPGPAKLKVADVQQVTADIFSSTQLPTPPAEATTTNATATDATATDATATDATATGAATTSTATTKENKTVTKDGLIIEDLEVGTGQEAKAGDTVTVHYRGTLTDGTKFDASYDRNQPFTFNLGAGEVIRGWDEGVAGMKEGGKRKLTIPPALGYGARGAGGVIPPNATLVFEVELLKVG